MDDMQLSVTVGYSNYMHACLVSCLTCSQILDESRKCSHSSVFDAADARISMGGRLLGENRNDEALDYQNCLILF